MEDNSCINLPANFQTPQTTTPINTSLYYKYEIGEIVEVEHEPNKYWLATVTYCFDQLNLLKWIGDYGEFWVDTTLGENLDDDCEIKTFKTTSLSPTSMRLYPPGYHKQSQKKSNFVLQVPKTFLTKHYSFNSVNYSYNDLDTLDDLAEPKSIVRVKEDADECGSGERLKDEEKNFIPKTPENYDMQTTDPNEIKKEIPAEKLNNKVVFDQRDKDELTLALDYLIELIEVKEKQESDKNHKENILIQSESNINKSKDNCDNENINSNDIILDSNDSQKVISKDNDETRHVYKQENNNYHTVLCSKIIEEAIELGTYHNNEYQKVFSIQIPKKPINEYFDLDLLNDNKQMEIDYILNENIKIYFNHKCFTGPSLSKGKICSLPQYVGPGPSRLVIEEIVSKIISVAYVPPRILNDLSSKNFSDLLITRGLMDTTAIEFKAKYQKRIHREFIPVCLRSNDVALYCECICEHLKCCYNLFGPNLYDGDDCPGHCRALTKSNKFMKRATYYREKARLGEFMNNNNNNNTESIGKKQFSNNNNKTSRARYAGRDSSESTSSSLSRSEQVNSRASSSNGGVELNQLDNGSITPSDNIKENLDVVDEIIDENNIVAKDVKFGENMESSVSPENDVLSENITGTETVIQEPEQISSNENQDVIMDTEIEHEFELIDNNVQSANEELKNVPNNILKQIKKPPIKWPNDAEFNMLDTQDLRPFEWSVDDVAEHLDWCRLSSFKPYMISEGVDGQALLLLDRAAIKEHFLLQRSKLEYSPEEVGKLCRFVEFVKNHAGLLA